MAVTPQEREQFVQWAVKQGAIISPYVSIRDSSLGGAGVFFNAGQFSKDNGPIQPDSLVEVLRVPKKLSLSLDTIAENFLRPQLTYDLHANGEWIQQGQILTVFLSRLRESFESETDPFVKGGLNETNILVGEIQVLTLLKQLREIIINDEDTTEDYKKFLRGSPVGKLDEYLSLLFDTDVDCIKAEENYQVLFKYHDREFRNVIESNKNNAIFNAFKDVIDEDTILSKIQKSFTPEVMKKIEMSVISRILEIPQEIESKESSKVPEEQTQSRYDRYNNVEETDFRKVLRSESIQEEPLEVETTTEHGRYDRYRNPETTDPRKAQRFTEGEDHLFAVASTMVPLIDFVNHSNNGTNSVFDVDRLNNDVLLKVKGEAFQGTKEDEVELFITYSEIEDVYKFIHAYGFIPWNSKRVVLYEHPIERGFLADYIVESEVEEVKYSHNYGQALKWFGILPNIQFKLTYSDKGQLEDVHLLLDENFSPFALARGLTYHEDRALDILKQGVDQELVGPEYVEDLLKLVEDVDNDVIETPGISPYSSALIEDEYLSIETILSSLDDEEINSLIGKYVDLLTTYFKTVRKPKLKQYLYQNKTGSHSLVRELAEFESTLIESFLSKVEGLTTDEDKIEHLMISSDDVDDEWLKLRMGPITVPGSKKLALFKKHGVKLDELNFNALEEDDINDQQV